MKSSLPTSQEARALSLFSTLLAVLKGFKQVFVDLDILIDGREGMNMKNKTLVAYASKGGATEEAAQIIADVLRDKSGLEVDIANLRKASPNLSEYTNAVVGGGVRGGKVYGEALKFLKQDFGDRKVAFFVCCGGAGDPEKYEESCTKYVTNVLTDYPSVKPVATEAFGGRMKILGKTIFDNIDPDRIRLWAEALGRKLNEK